MKIGIMQPYLFPYIGYFQLINAVDKFVLLDDVNFINRGWINRNKILVNGKESLFTIPLQGASQNKLINDTYITADRKWEDKLITTLGHAYKKAPYFNEVMPVAEDILHAEERNVSKKIFYSLQKLTAYLKMDTVLEPSSARYATQELKAQDKILSIAKQEQATDYINPIGGMGLYSKDKFTEEGINLYFLKTGEIVYSQFNHPFVPWLSILDVMMFNSIETINDLLGRYTLIQNE